MTKQGIFAMSFGSGLGTLIGSSLAAGDIRSGMNQVGNTAANFVNTTQPYNQFGQSFLSPASGSIGNISQIAGADPNLNYNTFMQNYQTSPGAAYTMDLANRAQENSAAAKGGLLSGANERALATIDTGIGNTFANQAYTNYLAGNQQQFGQLQSALGNMFNAIGVGQTATGQQAGIAATQMAAQTKLAEAQAKNSSAKGGGIGSMFNGLGALASGGGLPNFFGFTPPPVF
jgi:hypothetical protein